MLTPVARALALFAAARLAGFALIAAYVPHPLITMGLSWDSLWYWRIAEHGYGTVIPSDRLSGIVYSDLAFFPLYPALIRAFSTVLPIGPVDAALLLSWTATVLAAWGIHRVGTRLYGPRTALVLVVLWGLLPNSVVLTLAYTEPLLTACAAWALYAVLTGRWLCAGTLAALAGLTRPNGLAVAAAVITGALTDRGPRAWLGAAVAPLGWLAYVAWVGVRTGSPLGYFAVQSRWGSRFDFGRDTFLFSRHLLVDAGRLPYLPYYVALGTAVVALALLALSVRQGQPLPLLAYSAVLVAMALGGTGGGYYFQCKARFLLPAFPLLLPVAAAGAAMATARPRTAALAVVSMAGLSLAYGTYLVTAAHMAL